jgi:AGCS family alanine or glycine:cation symporter
MTELITEVNSAVNGFIWGVPAMVCIIGVGLWLSVRTGFIQIREFIHAIRITIGRMFHKNEASEGSLTPFQAVCTALAGTVGTGNIAGVAGAIAIGGPGAIFWMWCSAVLGMCTKFAEVTLAVHFREKNVKGDWVGGPMYYIKNGLSKKWHFLAYLYAVLGVLTVFGTGNATQVNTITAAIDSALINFGAASDVNALSGVNLGIGIAIAVLIALVLLGGLRRIGKVTEKLIPFMAVLYIVLALGVIFINIKAVPGVFVSIVEGAFSPSAVTGGVVGSLFLSMKKGVSRGIFSNEAGLGTGSIAHAAADTKEPVQQGFFGIFEVFADTIVICTMTALVILASGVSVNYGEPAGAELTISGFTNVYGGWVSILTALAMCCFAFSTILGWGLYGTRCLEFILGTKANVPFMILYSLVAIVGATADLGLMWDIADTCNGMMVIPNLIALFLLSGTVVKLVKDYMSRHKGL